MPLHVLVDRYSFELVLAARRKLRIPTYVNPNVQKYPGRNSRLCKSGYRSAGVCVRLRDARRIIEFAWFRKALQSAGASLDGHRIREAYPHLVG